MTQLDAIITQLTHIAKLEDIEMRTELGFFIRDLEREFARAEKQLETEFDNYPV